LKSFTHVNWPQHLSLDEKGRLLVADNCNHRIIMLNGDLQLEGVLVDSQSSVNLCLPRRVCYNELNSQLYVVHHSDERSRWSDVLSALSLR